MLTVLVEAERCAVRGYTHICNITAGKDHCTYELSMIWHNEELAKMAQGGVSFLTPSDGGKIGMIFTSTGRLH